MEALLRRTHLVVDIIGKKHERFPEVNDWQHIIGEEHDIQSRKPKADREKHIVIKNKILTTEEAISCQKLWDIDNGQVLCQKCHRKTKTYGGHSRLKII